MSVAMIGFAHSRFGKQEGQDVESLIGNVAAAALQDAGVSPESIDGIVLGWYNGGLSIQDFGSSLALHSLPGLRYKPSVRVENACATGTAAIHQGATAIEAKLGTYYLIIGVEKMTDTSSARIGEILRQASYVKEEADIGAGFAGVFARIAGGYFQKYGDKSDALAMIAAKNHRNGCDNPDAQMQKDLGYEFCRQESEKNPYVAAPLKRTDCSLVSDGAAAIVLCDLETAKANHARAVVLKSRHQVNDYLAMSKRDMTWMGGCEKAWAGALAKAGLSLSDLDFVETHDCFTIAELMQYEAMGLTQAGKGEHALKEGWVMRDGKLPINRSGGLKAKGHPIGATGVSMHVLASRQLLGEAGAMQLPNPEWAGIFNMGGAGVANYCSIIGRTW